ncbi:MAG: phospholipid carrier-dependent glycosyltransferase, partial [Clostridia bacterium]|nr:phospholipid carrier-dependent glycosyltransferase [Clostridia bacterium]
SLEVEAYKDGAFVPFTYLDMKSVFKWHYSVDKVTTDKLRFTTRFLRTDNEADKNKFYKAEYREIGFFSGNALIKDFKVESINATPGLEKLFDEQKIVPERPTVLNSTYFDEIYFPRTSYEQLEHKSILYENTHPPLGKTLLAIGISIFGMNPFGWRIMGTLFGAALIPLMYILGKRFFKDSFWAFFCAFMMMFDFMHFAQTRLATIDSYTVFFVMLMFYFMLDYYDSKSYERGLFKSLLPLLLCGIALGLGGATKWIALYGAFGLALLFFMSRGYEFSEYNHEINLIIKNEPTKKDFKSKSMGKWLGKYFYLTGLFCIVFFIVIPVVIYVLSFIPIHYNDQNKNLITSVLDSIKNMYNYHKGVTAPHPYSSSWFEWPLDLRPIFYYQGALLPAGMGAAIASFGNPLVWWSGLIAFFVILGIMISQIINKKQRFESNKLLCFPVIGYLSQYLPWVVAPRKLTFIYHYFSCLPFLILMVGLLFRFLEKENIISRTLIKVFMVLVMVLFIVYYPALSGLEVPRVYLDILRILPRWEW